MNKLISTAEYFENGHQTGYKLVTKFSLVFLQCVKNGMTHLSASTQWVADRKDSQPTVILFQQSKKVPLWHMFGSYSDT